MGKYLILGEGSSGRAAAELLQAEGHTVEFASGYTGVIASPGLCVRSELQLGCEALKRRGFRLLAVTGSKGKSSVVKVVADALTRAGETAYACGNYGLPVSALKDCPPGWAIVEVSSFMLETTTLDSEMFEGAVILNLQEDHLDRHGNARIYHALKRKLLSFARQGFCGCAEIPESRKKIDAALLKGSYFDNPILSSNGILAAELMRLAGLNDDQIRDGFRFFEPLPHRNNLVFEKNGVKYVDDSKATSLAALAAGVTMSIGPVRLIAGGLAKGDDPKSVIEHLTNKVKKVYLIGQCAEVFAEAWKSAVSCEICGTMERAVEAAVRDAETGETVLLSPGTASYDQFKNFGERGDVFADLVKRQRTNTNE